MQIPASNLRPNRFHRLVGYCRAEVDEALPLPILRSPRPKRVAEKIELLVRIPPSPILILAIDNLRLLRMKLQPTVLHASGYSRPNLLGLLPVRVPTVEGLLPGSFSFTSRLRLAVRYGCRHRLRLAPFIQQDSAHAGHTGAAPPSREPHALLATSGASSTERFLPQTYLNEPSHRLGKLEPSAFASR